MGIRRLSVKNYRAIAELDMEVPPAGMIVQGSNGVGKTSRLNAIRAALEARDIAPDAIRLGADKAEILVDLDHCSVRRVITPKQSTVTVTNGEGDRKAKPIAWLTELLGERGLDPLALYLAKPKERRELVLSTLPVKLTPEDVGRWLTEDLIDEVVTEPMFEMHGLEALGTLHKAVYDLRASANTHTKQLRAEVEIESAQIEDVAGKLPEELPSVEDAEEAVSEALTKVAEVRAAVKRAEDYGKRTASTRAQIDKLNAEASAIALPDALPQEGRDALHKAWHEKLRVVKDLEEKLLEAKAVADEVRGQLEREDNQASKRRELKRKRDELRDRAKGLADTLAEADEPAPESTALGHAEKLHSDAVARLDVAKTSAQVQGRVARLAERAAQLKKAEKRSEDLTKIVDHLRVGAPTELMANAKGIRGLGVDGDSITLDGISIDKVSGREQLQLSIEIAKRANPKGKLLVVDGLERIADDRLEDFVRFATGDGWQLIASRVTKGEVVVEALTADNAEAAE
jgi:hypothetical protein